MNRVLEKLHSIGVHAWLLFLQWLNGILVSLLGGVLIVHEAYPSLITGAISKLPPLLGVPLILLFGIMVHYALRRARKAT